ncbi:DUF2971 domain-containing protein [Aeromonas veronii]
MKVYYKYSRFFGIESLKNITIRLSSPNTLNDPFEGMMNEHVKKRLIKIAKPEDLGMQGYERHFGKEIINTFIVNKIHSLISKYGVVSLSETPINLLMWAHYADEHKGICIGFKPDLFDSLDNKRRSIYKIESYLPQKVNYDSIRPQNIDDEAESSKEIQEQARKQLLTKSNDWMYEKEHRCIIPLNWADQYKSLSTNAEDHDVENDFVNDGILTRVGENTYEGKGISILSDIYNDEKTSVFLKKINPSSIVSIHLGCKFDTKDKARIVEMLNDDNNQLKHIKLYACSPSKDRFELDIEQLYPLKKSV